METNSNPLLSSFISPHGAIPFDKIQHTHFLEALKVALSSARAGVQKIKAEKAVPSLENTLLALECVSEKADLVAEVFFNLLSAEAGEDMHALAKEVSPLLAGFASDLALDETLFVRIRELYESRTTLKMTLEQSRLLEKGFKSFARNGALLGAADKVKLRELDQELSRLGPQFSENVLKATYAFELEITRESDLAGLPSSAVEAAKELAVSKSKASSWIFTLEAPSYIPFVTYCSNRSLREKMHRAFGGRCWSGPFDNRDLLKKLATLRFERSRLLGYKTHSDYVLEERMAERPEKVIGFLEKLLDSGRSAAQREMSELKELALSLDKVETLFPWDIAYYSEKLKTKKFQFDEEDLRPYFKLENVVAGAFEHAKRLYDLNFTQKTDIPVYHPDVKVFEVSDASSGKFVGLFYTDFFPRPTKKGGAWMTALREQGLFEGVIRRPHISIVCNFTKSTATKPSLLTLNEVLTLFHEFGHALHGLLSQCTYRSVAGTNVYWDFVELPSQIMENWIREKEALDLFAQHYETNETMPAALANKISETSKFMAGTGMLRQLSFAFLDMAWHNGDPRAVESVAGFESEATERTRLLPRVEGVGISAAFSHIFAGGYSAGYYSYKWAEVLEADAFELFKEKGLFNREVSMNFRDNILSKGGTEHPMTLYKRFRGREPDAKALLRREGLL